MRIARDMHDGPAQSLANLVLQAEILERLIARDPQMVVSELHDFKDGVRAVLDDTRRLIFDLRPMSLDETGLVTALRQYASKYEERHKVRVEVRVRGEERRLPVSLETALYRFVQEELTNVLKHAGAGRVTLIPERRPDHLLAIVEDDGSGFDLTEVWESKEDLDTFNRDVFPKAMARAGIVMDGPPPTPFEFTPAAVMTPRAFASAFMRVWQNQPTDTCDIV